MVRTQSNSSEVTIDYVDVVNEGIVTSHHHSHLHPHLGPLCALSMPVGASSVVWVPPRRRGLLSGELQQCDPLGDNLDARELLGPPLLGISEYTIFRLSSAGMSASVPGNMVNS